MFLLAGLLWIPHCPESQGEGYTYGHRQHREDTSRQTGPIKDKLQMRTCLTALASELLTSDDWLGGQISKWYSPFTPVVFSMLSIRCASLCAVPVCVLCLFVRCARLCTVPVCALCPFVCCACLCAVPVCALCPFVRSHNKNWGYASLCWATAQSHWGVLSLSLCLRTSSRHCIKELMTSHTKKTFPACPSSRLCICVSVYIPP